MERKIVVILAMVILFISGCATNGINARISDLAINQPQEVVQKVEVKREPPYFIGVYDMNEVDVESGSFQARTGIFPEGLKAEMAPGRTTWYGWVIDNLGGEHLAQVVFTPWGQMITDSDGKDKVALFATIILDKSVKGGKLIAFSTMQEYVFDLLGENGDGIPLNWNKFQTDYEFRKEFVEKYGTDLSDLKEADYFYPVVKNWKKFSGPEGLVFHSPLSIEQVKEIAKINPGCSYFQKLVSEGNWFISPDLYSTGISAFFDLYRAGKSKPIAWSRGSTISREDMLYVNRYLSEIERMIITENLSSN